MKYECIGVNGFAGDRTAEAMVECHPFAKALSEFLGAPVALYGDTKTPQDLQWSDALAESEDVFLTAAGVIKESLVATNVPILITPRCASAIATLPVVVSEFSDVVLVYFDAHGDVNMPETSESGYLGGMPITAAMGEWKSGYGGGLKAKNIVHVGGRDLEQVEHDFIRDRKIMTLSKSEIESSLTEFSEMIRGRAVYVHIDTDVYDPSEVAAEYRVPNGLFRHHVNKVLSAILAHGDLVGIEITELSPKTDVEREHSYQALFDSLRPLLTTLN